MLGQKEKAKDVREVLARRKKILPAAGQEKKEDVVPDLQRKRESRGLRDGRQRVGRKEKRRLFVKNLFFPPRGECQLRKRKRLRHYKEGGRSHSGRKGKETREVRDEKNDMGRKGLLLRETEQKGGKNRNRGQE